MNSVLLEKISIKLFLDFVPPCEEMPDFLLITTKSLLSSINDLSFSHVRDLISDSERIDPHRGETWSAGWLRCGQRKTAARALTPRV